MSDATAFADSGNSLMAKVRPAAGRRFFDAATALWMMKVFPGEFYITRETNEVLVTVLGSCVSACIRDPIAGVGGMNHFMLPQHGSGAWGNDLIFLLFNAMLTKLGLLAVIIAIIFAAAEIVPASFQTLVGGLPYWVQIPAVIVLSDLGFYWTHRMFHAVPWLWRFHSIHHSIEELDWLAAARVHPVDQILTKGVSLIPVFALGFSEWAIGVYAVLYQWQAVLIHSNVRVGFGPLRFLFA